MAKSKSLKAKELPPTWHALLKLETPVLTIADIAASLRILSEVADDANDVRPDVAASLHLLARALSDADGNLQMAVNAVRSSCVPEIDRLQAAVTQVVKGGAS